MKKFFITLLIVLVLPCVILMAGCKPPKDPPPDDGDPPPTDQQISFDIPPEFEYQSLNLAEQERIYNIYISMLDKTLKQPESVSMEQTVKVVAKTDMANAGSEANSEKTFASATYYDKDNAQFVSFRELDRYAYGVVRRNNTYYYASYDFEGTQATQYNRHYLVDKNFAYNAMYSYVLSTYGLGVTWDNGFLTYSQAIEKEQEVWHDYQDNECKQTTRYQVIFNELENQTYSVVVISNETQHWTNQNINYQIVDCKNVYYTLLTIVFNQTRVLSSDKCYIDYRTYKLSETQEYAYSSSLCTIFDEEISYSVDESNFEWFDIYHNPTPFAPGKFNVSVYVDGINVYLREMPVGTTIAEIKNALANQYGYINPTVYADIQHYTEYTLDCIKSWEDTKLYMTTPVSSGNSRIRVVKTVAQGKTNFYSTVTTYENVPGMALSVAMASEENIFDKMLIDQVETPIISKTPITVYFTNQTQTIELIDYIDYEDFTVTFKGEQSTFAQYRMSKTLTLEQYTQYFHNIKYYQDLYFDANYLDIEFYSDENFANKLEKTYVVDGEMMIYVKINLKQNTAILAYKDNQADMVYSYVSKTQPLVYNVPYKYELYLYTFDSIYNSELMDEITYSQTYKSGEVSIDISELDSVIYIRYQKAREDMLWP